MSPTRATLCKLSTLALGSVASLFVAALVVNASAIAAPAELCRIDLSGERLTIHFPSGNHMTFTRSS